MKHSISISCSKENLSSIRVFVEATLRKYNISDLEAHKMVLAVDEVCANLIIHANNCNQNEHLEP